MHIFKWNDNDILNSISEISRLKITPGISHYIAYDEPGVAAGESLHELLKHAEKSIPNEFHASTTISLKATAGMRLLEREDQIRILHGVRKKLKSSSFLFESKCTRAWRNVRSSVCVDNCERGQENHYKYERYRRSYV